MRYLADVQLRALTLIRVVEAETLDALVQARRLRVEEPRGTGAALTRRGPARPRGPGREQRCGPRGGRGVGVVHDEDRVLEHDRDCVGRVTSLGHVMLELL